MLNITPARRLWKVFFKSPYLPTRPKTDAHDLDRHEMHYLYSSGFYAKNVMDAKQDVVDSVNQSLWSLSTLRNWRKSRHNAMRRPQDAEMPPH